MLKRKKDIFWRVQSRFLAIIFVAILLVMVTMILTVYLTTERSTRSQNERFLNSLINTAEKNHSIFQSDFFDEDPPADNERTPPDNESAPPDEQSSPRNDSLPRLSNSINDFGRNGMMLFSLDENGQIIETLLQNTRLSDEEITALIQQYFNPNKTDFRISSGTSSYQAMLRANGNGGYFLAMLNDNVERRTMATLFRVCVLAAAISLVISLLVSVLLSSRAMQPAKKAWKQQEDFIADAAHELKTPLAVIQANTDVLLLNQEETVSSQRKWLDYTKEEIQRMNHLIHEMLFLANNGQVEEKAQAFTAINMSGLCETSSLQFEPLFFEQSLDFQTEIAPSLYVYGDLDKMKQLVLILLDNMLKHSTSGSSCLFKLHGKANKIVLMTQNPCAVIAKENLPRLFDRFYQEDESRNQSLANKGTGLGLAIAKTIVEDSNGQIKASYENGELLIQAQWNRKSANKNRS